MTASREVNKIPLPPVRPASGLRIPHDRSNFLQTNYRLRNDLVMIYLSKYFVNTLFIFICSISLSISFISKLLAKSFVILI